MTPAAPYLEAARTAIRQGLAALVDDNSPALERAGDRQALLLAEAVLAGAPSAVELPRMVTT